MQVVPNFIEDKSVQEDIKSYLLYNSFGKNLEPFPYFYSDISHDGSNFMFFHILFLGEKDNNFLSPQFVRVLSPILGRLKFNYLMRAKVNLYTKSSEFTETPMHTDSDIPHKVALYSVNSNNGYTLFEDGTKMESVENQMIIFDGNRKHCSVAQTDSNTRVNININFR